MVIIDSYDDGMGGFQDSNMTHKNNLTIKQKNYNINVKDMKLFIIFYYHYHGMYLSSKVSSIG